MKSNTGTAKIGTASLHVDGEQRHRVGRLLSRQSSLLFTSKLSNSLLSLLLVLLPGILAVSHTAAGEGVKAASDTNEATGESPVDTTDVAVVTIPAYEPVTITGRVVTPDGRPVADAPVWLTRPALGYCDRPVGDHPWSYSHLCGETRTDGSGSFLFKITDPDLLKEFGPQAASGFFRSLVPCDVVTVVEGYAVSWQHVSSVRPLSPRTIVLREPAPIEGRLVDGSGEPIAGELVTLGYAFQPEHLTTRNLDDPHPLPDRNFLGLHHLVLSRELHESLVREVDSGDESPSPLAMFLRFVEAVSARTDREGRFVFQAAPQDLTCLLYTGALNALPSMPSAGGDRAQVAVSRIGRCTVAADPKLAGARPVFGALDNAQAAMMIQPNPVEIVATQRREVPVRVQYADTAAPAAGSVLNNFYPDSPYAQRIVSDADGRLVAIQQADSGLWIEPPPGARRYTTAYVSTAANAAGWNDGVLEVQLPRAAIVRGMVLDEQTREPIEGIPVLTRTVEQQGHGWLVPRPLATSDREGEFEFAVPPGQWQLFAGGPVSGWQFKDWQATAFDSPLGVVVTAKVDEPVGTVLTLQRSTRFRGQATLPDGRPAAGAWVATCFCTNANAAFDMLERTDGRGRFELPGLFADGGAELSADLRRLGPHCPGLLKPDGSLRHAPCRVAVFDLDRQVGRLITINPPATGAPDVDLDLPLESLHSVSGRIVDGATGRPVPNCIVRLLLLRACEGNVPQGIAPEVPCSYFVRTDADGRYKLTGLIRDAIHRVEVAVASGYGRGRGPLSLQGGDADVELADIELRAGDAPGRQFGWEGNPEMVDTSQITSIE